MGLLTDLNGSLLNPLNSGLIDSFQPPAINSVQMWLDAADESTITKDTSNKVSQWRSKVSKNLVIASQVTSVNQPTYNATGLNNRGVVEFANPQYLSINNTTMPHQTLFIVYNDSSNNAYTTPLGTAYDGAYGTYHGKVDNTGLFSPTFTEPDVVNGANYRGGVSIPDATMSARPSSYEYLTYIALSQQTRAVTLVGSDPLVGTRSITGGIAELILYDKAVTNTQRLQIESYLSQKWGL